MGFWQNKKKRRLFITLTAVFLAVAALIIVIGVDLGETSIAKIFDPQKVTFSALTVLILGLSMAVKLGLWLFNKALAKTIGSTALEATAQDSRNDAIATGAVLVAGLVEYFTGAMIDGWMGAAVALFILYSGAMLAKETINPLLGESASPELRELIVDYVRSQPKVLGFHDLMVHDYGPGQRFATLHVEMSTLESPLLCHELIDDMERECYQNHGIHLVIHYDPVITDDPELTRLKQCCEDLLESIDQRLHLHDFRMVQGEGHTNLIFDVALPFDLKGKEKQLKKGIEKALAQLQQGFGIFLPVAVDPQPALSHHAKGGGQGDARQGAETSANRLFIHTAQDHEGRRRHQHGNQEGGGDRGPAQEQQGQQNEDQRRHLALQHHGELVPAGAVHVVRALQIIGHIVFHYATS